MDIAVLYLQNRGVFPSKANREVGLYQHCSPRWCAQFVHFGEFGKILHEKFDVQNDLKIFFMDYLNFRRSFRNCSVPS